MSAFRGNAVAQGAGGAGGNGNFDIPSEDTHEARLVAIIDMGTHREQYQGQGDAKPKRKVYLAWELDEKMPGGEYHFVVGQQYTLSFHEMSSLRQLAETLRGEKYLPNADIDYLKMLGSADGKIPPVCALVTIKHKDRGEGKRKVAQISNIGPVPKARRPAIFTPQRKPISWELGGDLKTLPDWLPFYFGHPLADEISQCEEMRGGGRTGGGASSGMKPTAAQDDGSGYDPDADGAGVANAPAGSEIPF